MKIYLDSAQLEEVCQYIDWYSLDGVTCNPTILQKSNCELSSFLSTIPTHVTCFAQVIQTTYEGMLEDAEKILALRSDTVIKIPVTKEGFHAITTLHKRGVKTLATAIYHANQALLAAKCGAEFVAPYVNRMCDLELDGVATTLAIQNAFRISQTNCEVVAASFKNLSQIRSLLTNGVDAVTIPLDLFEKLLDSPYTKSAVDDFGKDYFKLCGKNKL